MRNFFLLILLVLPAVIFTVQDGKLKLLQKFYVENLRGILLFQILIPVSTKLYLFHTLNSVLSYCSFIKIEI